MPAPCIHLWSIQAGAMQNIVSFAGCLRMLSCFHLHSHSVAIQDTYCDWLKSRPPGGGGSILSAKISFYPVGSIYGS